MLYEHYSFIGPDDGDKAWYWDYVEETESLMSLMMDVASYDDYFVEADNAQRL